ncbi:exportin-T [Iris pallida]|uniref:Exportin-T n=1 Tax=Iris pallida TaxID=29817 RepID=A0AAX6HW24_IRIPA|nr:exportin-T [Iris pallida]
MRVKDAMRLQCVPQIASFFYDSVGLYRSSDTALAAAVLDTMKKYVSWIDINLVANSTFLGLLFGIMEAADSADQLKLAAGNCLLAIVSKRMDSRSKLALLRTLKPQMGRLFSVPELVVMVGGLITGYAAEALDCYKRLGSAGEAMELLEEALPLLFYVMEESDEVDLCNVVGFLADYVSTMKRSPSQKQVVYVGQILELIRNQICYDPKYRKNLDVPDKIGREEEDLMAEQRKELFLLFRGVCRVAPEATRLFIRNLIANAMSSSEANVEEVEAALSLFYQLGETVSEEEMKSGSGLLAELVAMLLSARFSCHSHRVVALVYLETITRYMKFVLENTQYIPNVLAAFLDERGIHHPNPNVGRRASYLFMRAVKLLKSKLVPFIDTILQNLQDTVARYTSLDWSSKELKCSGSEDGSHTFEAIGLMIGMEDIPPEKQSDYLAALLKPLCQQVETLLLEARVQGLEESSAKVLSFQRLIVAMNALSKGFSERLVTTNRPAIGIMFKQTLDVLLQVLVTFPSIKPLRNKVTSFLHRMVEILGVSVFPYLPMALNQLLVESEPKDMVDFLILINQVIYKFSTSVRAMLEEIFPTIASKLFNILSSDAFSSGPGSNTEEIRELQELQRTLYTFLHVMTTHDLSSVFLAQNSRGYLDATMQLLLIASCSHKDVVVRKMCVQIFVKLMKDWCTKYNGGDKVPGFRTFIIEKFATNCCLYSVLDKSFELRDANTFLLFGEIVMAQKVMYEKFGDDFLVHFVSKALTAAHCPQDLAEQYYQKLQGNDIKALKSFYQSLVEKLRPQQNGSLVFR